MKLKTLMINSAGFLNSKLRFYANLRLPLIQGHELKLLQEKGQRQAGGVAPYAGA